MRVRVLGMLIWLLAAAALLSGCGLFFGGEEAPPSPTAPVRTLVPTFTPTSVPVEPPTATPAAAAVAPTQVITVAVEPTPTDAPAAGVIEPTPTPAPEPKLKVEQDQVNVRTGPGTQYGLAGTVNLAQEFVIKGRNADRSWWLICCVNGQEVWIFGELTDPENEELAPLVEVTAPAAAPVAAAPAPLPTPAPAEPTATPVPPPAADACAGIGGDGCKFRLRGGPSFAANGGGELKLQIHFIHSGVDGGQPQGSYFVWLEKDGQKLPVSDGVRSIALQDQQGTLGKYNYEFKLGLNVIPGNTVAGTYAIWVLDGNGERDSQTFTFTVPDGQGEVWIEFDQG